MTSPLVTEVSEHLRNLFDRHLPPRYLFHSFDHTEDVLSVCREIADACKLSEEEREHLFLAAWFNNSGYIHGYADHEEHSAKLARTFLSERNYPGKRIEAVIDLIHSTRPDHLPKNQLEEILHDANLSHIGTKRFFRKSTMLRIERESQAGKPFTSLQWEEIQFEFLVSNRFYTPYAQQKFNDGLAANIKKQKEILDKAREKRLRDKTGKDFGRGIDTLFRSVYRNHTNLSSIADGKANMMITINTTLISAIIGAFTFFYDKAMSLFEENPYYILPLVVFLLFSLVSAISAVLSARPKITQRKMNPDVLQKKETSLLYFGNFISLNMADFISYLKDLKRDQELLYDNMSIDLYYLGKVLMKKFRLLKLSYDAFMIGLVIAVLGFFIVFFL